MNQQSSQKLTFGVVILAAGRSRRMGQPKLLLPWRATTILGHMIEQWRGLDAGQIGVVCEAGNTGLEAELVRLGVPESDRIVNPAPERGMFSSIQCAAAWSGWQPEPTHWVISLGDQPHVRRETLRNLLVFGFNHADMICQPLRHGKRRHPVWLPRSAFQALRASSASNLKEFLEQRSGDLAGFVSDDAGLDLDLDTPADYERARQWQ